MKKKKCNCEFDKRYWAKDGSYCMNCGKHYPLDTKSNQPKP